MPGNNLTVTSGVYNTVAAKFGTGTLAPGTGVGPTMATLGISASTGFTAECWASSTITVGSIQVILGPSTTFYLGIAIGNTARGNVGSGGSQVALTSSANIVDASLVYHHLVLQSDATGSDLYCDGTRVATNATALSATAAAFTAPLGVRDFETGGVTFSGAVDEVAIFLGKKYSGASFTVPSSPYVGNEAGLVALYHLDGNGTDSSGSASATSYTLTGPSSGSVGVASSNFTVQITGTTATSTTITPSAGGGGGTFSPTSVTLAAGTSNSGTFTYTAATAGAKTISTTNSASLADPSSVTYTASAGVNIFPNDANIIYSPGNWDVTSVRAKSINPGAEFKLLIAGTATAITLSFDLGGIATNYPEVSVGIDGGAMTAQVLTATIALAIPSSNSWTTHEVRFRFKSRNIVSNVWSPQAQAIQFTGISTTPGSCTTVAASTASLKGMAFGDSITEGYGIYGNSQTPDTARADVGQNYAYEMGRLIGADVGIVGFDGTGLFSTGQGGVPGLASTYNVQWSGGPSRSFAGLDFLVINEGHNDGGTASGPFITEATARLNAFLTAVPASCQIFVMRPFSGVHAADWVSAISVCANPARVTYIDTTGWFNTADAADGLHPYGYTSRMNLAPRLAAALRTKLRGVANRWVHA